MPRILFWLRLSEFSSPGLIGCWATMLAFGRAMCSYELPVLYAIGCTLLQGSFCLGELNSVVSKAQLQIQEICFEGMIWKMNPFEMPRAFCIGMCFYLHRLITSLVNVFPTAQSTFIGYGTFLLTGVAASFSIGTSLTVLKPKTWGDHGKSCVCP